MGFLFGSVINNCTVTQKLKFDSATRFNISVAQCVVALLVYDKRAVITPGSQITVCDISTNRTPLVLAVHHSNYYYQFVEEVLLGIRERK